MPSTVKPPDKSHCRTMRGNPACACALGCAMALLALAMVSPAAKAAPVHGSAFIGGSWMIGSQSYFSVTMLGRTTVGWCLNPGAAEPLPGWYSFSADKTVRSSGEASVWLDGSLEPVSYDQTRGVSVSSAVTFRAGTSDASWSVAVPSGCVLFVDGTPHPAGASVRVSPGQKAWIESSSPTRVRTAVLSGTAQASASVRVLYDNIVIVPPGAWDGHSYANGRPAGYQRVGVGPLVVEESDFTSETLAATAVLAADVNYFVDGDSDACWSECAPVGSTFTPSQSSYQAGRKPSCTPGLDAWYFDAGCTLPYAPFVLRGPTALYGQNWCTLSFQPAASSGFQHETPAVDAQSPDARGVPLSETLPEDIVATWGSRVELPLPREKVLYFHDGVRWRTLRRPGNGWHRSPSATDEETGAVTLLRDTTLYDFWTTSTFDGVIGW